MQTRFLFVTHLAVLVVIALNDEHAYENELRQALYSHFIPHKSIVWRKNDDQELLHFIPFLQKQAPVDKKTTLYICHEGVCQKPITDFQEMMDSIHRL